jgi:plastocyanin
MKPIKYLRAALVVAALACVAALAPKLSGVSSAEPRTIHIVVKDMTFYVEGDKNPNPTLYASPGERVRLVLHNTQSGIAHDFTIESWKVHTRMLKGVGEDTIEFRVPEARGSHAYRCTPHAAMMNGTIVVN